MNFNFKAALLSAALCSFFVNASNNAEPTQQSQAEEHEEGGITLSAEQMAMANISVQSVVKKKMTSIYYAPGEIKSNGYTNYYVTPRVESVVLKRHAKLGEVVEKNQPLVTFFSEDVAQAQADYRIANSEWQRIKLLTKETISESKSLSIQTQYFAAYSRLKAYGLTDAAIEKVTDNNLSNLGEYTLKAEKAGAVLVDDFHQGQRIEAGSVIMVLTEESLLWVEAKLPAYEQMHLPKGTQTQLIIEDDIYLATVIQEAHTIDKVTRTRIVRLEVKNSDHKLHPGMFVDVNFSQQSQVKVFAVPEEALVRSCDGDWQLFIEHEANEFEPKEIELGRRFYKGTQQWREVFGVNEGDKVVFSGAFFVASELAKGGFDPHGH